MRIRWLFIVQAWACSALATEPGRDFAITDVWPPFIQSVQDASPTAVRFNVTGCEQFSVRLLNRENDTKWGSGKESTSEAAFSANAHGGYTLQLDPRSAAPTPHNSCHGAQDFPYEFNVRLAVTCMGDGRTVTSDPIPVRYAPSAGNIFVGLENVMLEPLDANRVLVVGEGVVSIQRLKTMEALQGFNYQPLAVVRPYRSTHNATQAFFVDRCSYPHCDLIQIVDPETHESTWAEPSVLWTFNTDEASPDVTIDSMTQVPGFVVQMYPDLDGSVLILSITENLAGQGVILSRLTAGQISTESVASGAAVKSWNDGSNSPFYVTTEGGAYQLRNIRARDGQPIELPGAGALHSVHVAPDGRHWVYQRDNAVWLGGVSQQPQLVLEKLGSVAGGLGGLGIATVAWLADSVAVATALSAAEITFIDYNTGAVRAVFSSGGEDAEWLSLRAVGPHHIVAAGPYDAYLTDDQGHQLIHAHDAEVCGYNRAWLSLQLEQQRVAWMQGPWLKIFDYSAYLD